MAFYGIERHTCNFYRFRKASCTVPSVISAFYLFRPLKRLGASPYFALIQCVGNNVKLWDIYTSLIALICALINLEIAAKAQVGLICFSQLPLQSHKTNRPNWLHY